MRKAETESTSLVPIPAEELLAAVSGGKSIDKQFKAIYRANDFDAIFAPVVIDDLFGGL